MSEGVRNVSALHGRKMVGFTMKNAGLSTCCFNRLGQYTTAGLTLIFIHHNTNRRGETVTSFRNSVVAGVDYVHGEYRGELADCLIAEALTEGITIDFFTDITFGSPKYRCTVLNTTQNFVVRSNLKF